MPVKTYRRTKRNLERQFLIDNSVNVIWHHKTAHQVEPLFQLALNQLAQVTGKNIFEVYVLLDLKLRALKSRAQTFEEDGEGVKIFDDGGLIDKLSTCFADELRAKELAESSPDSTDKQQDD